MNLKTTIERKLNTAPSITITIRSLSEIERRTRNARIEGYEDYERLVIDMQTTEEPADRRKLVMSVEQIEICQIRPAIIREGLVGVRGLTIDGKSPENLGEAVEGLLKHAGDEVIYEIFTACLLASELTEEQEKNWLSLGTSSTPGQPGTTNTIAPSVAEINFTPDETVSGSFPKT
jgi:hypothetical protein